MEWPATVLRALVDPVRWLALADKRLFGPYLLASAAIAYAVWRHRTRGKLSFREFLRYLFPVAIWRHASTRLDLTLLLVNAWFVTLTLATLGLSTYSVASVTARHFDTWLGVRLGTSSAPWVVACYTTALFVVDDASRFALHALLHRVPALWRLHQVHHTAEVLTPLTLYRVHPVEALLFALRALFVYGGVYGAFVHFTGRPPRSIDVLGVNAFVFCFNALGANLRHSHVPLAYPPWLERWLIAPAQHQLHHTPRGADRNYGSALALWDRLLGSWAPSPHAFAAFGLEDSPTKPGRHTLSRALGWTRARRATPGPCA